MSRGYSLAWYRCPRHGVIDVVVDLDADGKPPAQQRCQAAVRHSGCSHGGSGPDQGFTSKCCMAAPLEITD